MKKKILQLRQLNLTKETILQFNKQNTVKGGTNAKTVTCEPQLTEGTVAPCCPACRSGANETVVKEFCATILDTIDKACGL